MHRLRIRPERRLDKISARHVDRSPYRLENLHFRVRDEGQGRQQRPPRVQYGQARRHCDDPHHQRQGRGDQIKSRMPCIAYWFERVIIPLGEGMRIIALHRNKNPEVAASGFSFRCGATSVHRGAAGQSAPLKHTQLSETNYLRNLNNSRV